MTTMTFPETLDEAVREAVRAWSAGAEYHFHTLEEAGEAALLDEMRAAMAAARDTVARCAEGLAAGSRPGAVLEVGCSIGVKLVALAEHFAGAEVRGLDPEASALAAARALATQSGHAIELDQGVGEALPYADGRFDLVLCHTVIEHVADVDACIAEMARVLKPGGVLHLEAPNYIWPFEPHLKIWMPPLCPKPLMRGLARLQGKSAQAAYTDHLKLVHPRWLERAFRHNGLEWENRFAAKLRAALSGNLNEVVNYRRLARLLAALGRSGLGRPLAAMVVALGLYPSVIYTARKPQ